MLRVLSALVLVGGLGGALAGEPVRPDAEKLRAAQAASAAAIAAARGAPHGADEAAAGASADAARATPAPVRPTLGFEPDPGAVASLRAWLDQMRTDAPAAAQAAVAAAPRPLVFVSLSMPEPSLRALLAESEALAAALVLRGLVDDSMPRTVERLAALLEVEARAQRNPRSIRAPDLLIDPTLFERFGIEAVPTFVVPLDAPGRCEASDGCATPRHAKLAGDVSLAYALEVVASRAREPEARAAAARWLLARERAR